MAQYAIYKIKFRKSDEPSLDKQEVDADKSLEHAREHFGSLFAGNILKIFRVKNDGTADMYPNYVWKGDNDVYLVRLSNRQLMSLYLLKDNPKGGAPSCVESKVESNPYCFVVVDNREGRCQIAIEKSSAWRSNPDAVRDLLEGALCRHLSDNYKLWVSFQAKMQPTKIWEYCHHRVCDLHDPITRVSLEVDNPDKVKPYNAPEPMSANVRGMVNLVKNTNALKGLLTIYAAHNDPLEMDRKIEDMAEIVSLCSSNAYRLTIHFKNMKAYRCNERVKAFFPMPNGAVEAFQQGNKALDEHSRDGEFELVQWLEHVYEETKNFEDASQTHRPRKNRHK